LSEVSAVVVPLPFAVIVFAMQYRKFMGGFMKRHLAGTFFIGGRKGFLRSGPACLTPKPRARLPAGGREARETVALKVKIHRKA
jgi:hypothetical protein